jgi:hypothetical protein
MHAVEADGGEEPAIHRALGRRPGLEGFFHRLVARRRSYVIPLERRLTQDSTDRPAGYHR